MAEPFEPVFRISYALRGRNTVQKKYFKSAEDCRAWLVDHQAEFSSWIIVEMNHISFERLRMLAQLENECAELGCN